MRVLRTKDLGACVFMILATKVIFVLSLVATLGKCAFRIQNPSLFIDCSIENVLRWYTGEVENSNIRFCNSSHINKQVSNSFYGSWLGREGVHKGWKVSIA